MNADRDNSKAGSWKPKSGPTPFRSRQATSQRPYDRDAWLKRNTGQEIKTISKDELQRDPAPVTSRTDFDLLCSYNWLDAATPAIYVPGAPPTWNTPTTPFTLPEDKGGRYIDQNAHRVPDHPFEPIFRAMTIMKPDYDFADIDVVANRNSMRKLLNFINGTVYDSFRIDLNVVQNTLFLTRRERKTKEKPSNKGQYLGYGHSFETSCTVPQQGLENSTSHHRAARYKLGSLDIAIRYEVDAWISVEKSDKDDEQVDGKNDTTNRGVLSDNPAEDDLLASLKGLTLAGTVSGTAGPRKRGTRVIPRGVPVDATGLAEMKAKGKKARKFDLISQLWFGRIPYLAMGLHENGVFDNVSITPTAEDFDKFEEEQQGALQKLVHVIKLLKDETMKTDGQACVVVCERKTKPLALTLYTSTNKRPVLPKELIEQYWGDGQGQAIESSK